MQNNFVVGLSSIYYFNYNLNNLNDICQKYKKFINTWYFSPPFKQYYYNSRLGLKTNNDIKDFLKEVKIVKNNFQNIQLALNGSFIEILPLKEIEQDFFYWEYLFGEPNSIVLKDFLIPSFLKYNIPLIYSYNNYYPKTKFKNLKYCTHIVLGNKDLRNIAFMEKIKDKYNVKIELLLNNGCHFLCNKECDKCQFFQKKRLTQISFEQALAEQSLLPSELKLYPKELIDLYKISSRPSYSNYLDSVLQYYTSNISINELQKKIDLKKSQNWKLFCRLNPLFYENTKQDINIEKVIDYKYQIWKNILNTNNFDL